MLLFTDPAMMGRRGHVADPLAPWAGSSPQYQYDEHGNPNFNSSGSQSARESVPRNLPPIARNGRSQNRSNSQTLSQTTPSPYSRSHSRSQTKNAPPTKSAPQAGKLTKDHYLHYVQSQRKPSPRKRSTSTSESTGAPAGEDHAAGASTNNSGASNGNSRRVGAGVSGTRTSRALAERTHDVDLHLLAQSYRHKMSLMLSMPVHPDPVPVVLPISDNEVVRLQELKEAELARRDRIAERVKTIRKKEEEKKQREKEEEEARLQEEKEKKEELRREREEILNEARRKQKEERKKEKKEREMLLAALEAERKEREEKKKNLQATVKFIQTSRKSSSSSARSKEREDRSGKGQSSSRRNEDQSEHSYIGDHDDDNTQAHADSVDGSAHRDDKRDEDDVQDDHQESGHGHDAHNEEEEEDASAGVSARSNDDGAGDDEEARHVVEEYVAPADHSHAHESTQHSHKPEQEKQKKDPSDHSFFPTSVNDDDDDAETQPEADNQGKDSDEEFVVQGDVGSPAAEPEPHVDSPRDQDSIYVSPRGNVATHSTRDAEEDNEPVAAQSSPNKVPSTLSSPKTASAQPSPKKSPSNLSSPAAKSIMASDDDLTLGEDLSARGSPRKDQPAPTSPAVSQTGAKAAASQADESLNLAHSDLSDPTNLTVDDDLTMGDEHVGNPAEETETRDERDAAPADLPPSTLPAAPVQDLPDDSIGISLNDSMDMSPGTAGKDAGNIDNVEKPKSPLKTSPSASQKQAQSLEMSDDLTLGDHTGNDGTAVDKNTPREDPLIVEKPVAKAIDSKAMDLDADENLTLGTTETAGGTSLALDDDDDMALNTQNSAQKTSIPPPSSKPEAVSKNVQNNQKSASTLGSSLALDDDLNLEEDKTATSEDGLGPMPTFAGNAGPGKQDELNMSTNSYDLDFDMSANLE